MPAKLEAPKPVVMTMDAVLANLKFQRLQEIEKRALAEDRIKALDNQIGGIEGAIKLTTPAPEGQQDGDK